MHDGGLNAGADRRTSWNCSRGWRAWRFGARCDRKWRGAIAGAAEARIGGPTRARTPITRRGFSSPPSGANGVPAQGWWNGVRSTRAIAD